ETLSKLERTSSGRALLEAHQKQWAGVVEPLRYIQAAIIYLDLKDADALRFALDRAAETMGGHPGLKVLHRVLEACSSAEAGKSDDAERRLKQGREILEGPIGRIWNCDFGRFAGRAYIALGRADAAIAALEEALRLSVHPFEKHGTRFWLAKAHELKGDK